MKKFKVGQKVFVAHLASGAKDIHAFVMPGVVRKLSLYGDPGWVCVDGSAHRVEYVCRSFSAAKVKLLNRIRRWIELYRQTEGLVKTLKEKP